MNTGTRPSYDYVLVVGPGRSGSTYLFRLLNGQAGFTSPEIKEGYYYRSARRLARMHRQLPESGGLLLDVANLAWRDPALQRVTELGHGGCRVLLVLLLRSHRDRARSMLAFRRSRVLPWRLMGKRRLMGTVFADLLMPRDLERLFGLGADVLTIGFEALTTDPRTVLDQVAQLCGTPDIALTRVARSNPSVAARSLFVVGIGRVVSVILRGIGAHRMLQWLKDQPEVMNVLFRPLRADERIGFGDIDARRLDQEYAACLETVERMSERLTEGVWLHRYGGHKGA